MDEKIYMKFSLPALWREPRNHVDDCMMNVVGINAKKLSKLEYANVSSMSKPIPRTSND